MTLVERALGRLTSGSAAALIAAQLAGGLVGVIVANLMFDLSPVTISGNDRSGGGHLLGEIVATLGLVLIVFGALRSPRIETVAFAVGGYIAAAYWFTSSTSFANPAVTIARMLSDTFAGIAPSSVPGFVLDAARRRCPRAGRRPGPLPHAGAQETAVTDQATRSRPRILYACRANGGRSVISKVLTEHYGGDAIQVSSAGSEPGSKVHPEVVQALADLGLDASNEQPKSFDPTASYDVVITQGCGGKLPRLPRRTIRRLAARRPQGARPRGRPPHHQRNRPACACPLRGWSHTASFRRRSSNNTSAGGGE